MEIMSIFSLCYSESVSVLSLITLVRTGPISTDGKTRGADLLWMLNRRPFCFSEITMMSMEKESPHVNEGGSFVIYLSLSL